MIAVKVDSMTRNDIPPEGGSIDYFVWGGIVRDVNMIVTDPVQVDWTFITTPRSPRPARRSTPGPGYATTAPSSKSVTVVTSVVDATNNVVATGTATQTIARQLRLRVRLQHLGRGQPEPLASGHARTSTRSTRRCATASTYVDEHRTRLGIRIDPVQRAPTAGSTSTAQPFKLRGLNRHESYPYIGRAAPNRLQAKDADILKFELGVNIVRTSHYPQDPEFLDRADEIGLMVLEEIPGWQHIGNTAWQDIAVENVREMVMRDRNHPSIVLWGVRINESGDNNAFYTRTNNLARQLDPSRPTGGVRNFRDSEFLEDVYTYNDFSGGAQDPAVLPWLITEAVGHTDPDRSWDPERVLLQTMRTHLNARVGFTVSGPGAVVGENPLTLEAGVGAVYVKSALNQTGTVSLAASAPGLTSAPAVNVAVAAFTAPIVPASGSYAFGFPLDINDRVQFTYAGTGWSTGSDNLVFHKDNTWCGTTNDTATLPFTGNRVVLYGVQDPTHGSAAISIDGGAEQTVSFANATRRGNVALFSSATLSQGSHTLRVRVTGNGPIALDRATVVAASPATIAAPAATPGALIPQSQWSLRFVDSQELEGEGRA